MNKLFVFFGTPDFAAIVLQELIDTGFPPALLVCNPDRPVGRKKVVTPPPIKALVIEHETWNIKILQPEQLDESFKFQVLSFKPDFAIVAAYAKIIPKEILGLFPKGVIGVHPSLLPKYRGATPIQSVILADEEESGITLYLLDEKVDHGPILAQRKLEFPISNFKFSILSSKLAELGGALLAETLPKFILGEITPKPQNDSEATYTKKFTAEEAEITHMALEKALSSSEEEAKDIERKIRALTPEPGVWTTYPPLGGGKRVKLLEAEVRGARLVLRKIQVEGKNPRIL